MAHDFILVRGKLTDKQIIDEMHKCVQSKHSQIRREIGVKTICLMFGDHHDVDTNVDVKKSTNVEYYHGYYGGIFYDVFNCKRFDRGVSGSGESINQNGKQVKKKIKLITDKIFLNSEDSHANFYARNLLKFCEKLSDEEILTVIFC